MEAQIKGRLRITRSERETQRISVTKRQTGRSPVQQTETGSMSSRHIHL